MQFDPSLPKSSTSSPASFAYKSVRERWPTIVTNAIKDVQRQIDQYERSNPKIVRQGMQIVAELECLKQEMHQNCTLSPLPDEEGELRGDVAIYNQELQDRGAQSATVGVRWHEVEWLFSECYLYRRLFGSFSRRTLWETYDVFQEQKRDAFKQSKNAVLEMAAYYVNVTENIGCDSGTVLSPEAVERNRAVFSDMMQQCLWGNATDLSLLTTLTYENIQQLQGSEVFKRRRDKVLVNDLDRAFDLLWQARNQGEEHRTMDFVLDNAGFELFVDVVVICYLLKSGLATNVKMHAKQIPWFVSDATPTDIEQLFDIIQRPLDFFKDSNDSGSGDFAKMYDEQPQHLEVLHADLRTFQAEGRLAYQTSNFWTQAGSFWRLPISNPGLFAELRSSLLVVLKGDLNYRKLVGDACWDPTTPFQEALGPLGKSSKLNILSLRTCKADVVVGLPPGKDEELRSLPEGGGESGLRAWALDASRAVMQFSKGR
ncbi:Hairy/enhancer-of-split with YRPW motif protein 2 [Exophiala oligosperma]